MVWVCVNSVAVIMKHANFGFISINKLLLCTVIFIPMCTQYEICTGIHLYCTIREVSYCTPTSKEKMYTILDPDKRCDEKYNTGCMYV